MKEEGQKRPHVIAKPMQWTGHTENRWSPIGETAPMLPPGYYTILALMPEQWCLSVQPLVHDTIIHTGIADSICKDIDVFWAAKEKYNRFGFLHKRGVLMMGEPGVGKSMTAMALCHHIIKNGGVAVAPPTPHRNMGLTISNALKAIRALHPNMPILNLMEDIEMLFDVDPQGILNLLDGEAQINNVVHVAITNFPARLDARLLKRRGRFDEVVWVKSPEAAVRREYLKTLMPADAPANMVEDVVAATDGLSLADMKEVIAGVFVLGRTPTSVVKGIRTNNKRADALLEAAAAYEDADNAKDCAAARAKMDAIVRDFAA